MGMICNFSAIDLPALTKLQSTPKLISDYIWPLPKNYLDLHKYWDVISFILADKQIDAGTTPQSWAVLGGTYFGDDVGYGPARFLTPKEVKEVANALAAISESQFALQFDAKELSQADVYPAWDWSDPDVLKFTVDYFQKLKAFYKHAAADGKAILIWLN